MEIQKGSKSVAVGMNALFTQNFTTATDVFNTAVGADAGSVSNHGHSKHPHWWSCGEVRLLLLNYTVAVGYSAVTSATTGHSNSALGETRLKEYYHRLSKRSDW